MHDPLEVANVKHLRLVWILLLKDFSELLILDSFLHELLFEILDIFDCKLFVEHSLKFGLYEVLEHSLSDLLRFVLIQEMTLQHVHVISGQSDIMFVESISELLHGKSIVLVSVILLEHAVDVSVVLAEL